MSSVNSSSSRAERARQTRRRMLESARTLFLSQGYPDTTMSQIAEAADVAVQTLYYTFKTKGRLLIEVVEVTAAGTDDRVPVPERAWYKEMMASTSAQRQLALIIEHGTAIYERVAELWPIVDAAIADPDVAEYWQGVASGRRRSQHQQVVRMSELTSLRPGLSIEQATDLMVLLEGHAPYRALVQDAGWPMVDYRAWLFTTLVQQLLAEPIDPDAIADLSFGSRVLR